MLCRYVASIQTRWQKPSCGRVWQMWAGWPGTTDQWSQAELFLLSPSPVCLARPGPTNCAGHWAMVDTCEPPQYCLAALPPPPLHSWPVSRHPVNGWMAARCPQLGTTAVPCHPPSPVNKLQQIHYPDKSMINCTFYIFSRNRSAVPNNGQSEKQRWFTPILNKPFDSIKPPPTPPGQTFVVQERSQQVQKQFWSFITFQWWHSPRPAPARLTTPPPPRPGRTVAAPCEGFRCPASVQCPQCPRPQHQGGKRQKISAQPRLETRLASAVWRWRVQ